MKDTGQIIEEQLVKSCGSRLNTNGDLVPAYTIKEDNDGFCYAVFRDCFDAYLFDVQFPHYFEDCLIVCYGNQDNAFFIGRLH